MKHDPDPFAYASTPHVRKHGPHGYKGYESYRPWLRDEFVFRCVFCLYREQWPATRGRRWEIDHLLPQTAHSEGTLDYDNLIYLCATCNGNKRAKLVPDPCDVALGRCVHVLPDGQIKARNSTGRLLIKALRLDNDDYTRVRRDMIGILKTLAAHNRLFYICTSFPFGPERPAHGVPPLADHHSLGLGESSAYLDRLLFVSFMGFPRDLPDLARQTPPDNKRPEGIARSYHALRTAGKLAELY